MPCFGHAQLKRRKDLELQKFSGKRRQIEYFCFLFSILEQLISIRSDCMLEAKKFNEYYHMVNLTIENLSNLLNNFERVMTIVW